MIARDVEGLRLPATGAESAPLQPPHLLLLFSRHTAVAGADSPVLCYCFIYFRSSPLISTFLCPESLDYCCLADRHLGGIRGVLFLSRRSRRFNCPVAAHNLILVRFSLEIAALEYTRLEDDEKRSRVAEASDQTEAAKKRRKEKGNLKNDGVWRIASISGASRPLRSIAETRR
ncbi:hypothetical protein SDJN02_15991, partial [Cucurbita argyrosperma subsp. argyrosperma]